LPPEDWDLAQITALQKPSRVEQARGRLDAALAKLESALAAKPASQGDNPDAAVGGALSGAMAEATARISDLQAELDKVRARNAELHRVNDQVGTRIDGVIAKLKSSVGA
jgi:glutathione S-transferase